MSLRKSGAVEVNTIRALGVILAWRPGKPDCAVSWMTKQVDAVQQGGGLMTSDGTPPHGDPRRRDAKSMARASIGVRRFDGTARRVHAMSHTD